MYVLTFRSKKDEDCCSKRCDRNRDPERPAGHYCEPKYARYGDQHSNVPREDFTAELVGAMKQMKEEEW